MQVITPPPPPPEDAAYICTNTIRQYDKCSYGISPTYNILCSTAIMAKRFGANFLISATMLNKDCNHNDNGQIHNHIMPTLKYL